MMKIEEISLDELTLDPNNARTHDVKNLNAIAGSLEIFGQRKPIVIDSANVVVAGNGTVQAAKLLGWKKIACVRIPADWSDDQIKAYALADNRTAELAKWDEEILGIQLLELNEADFPIEKFGFVQKEDTDKLPDTEKMDFEERYEVVIECANEVQQQELLDRFVKEGFRVRAIVI
jgi:ParB-like chromosome segregation protein Spo0J